MLIQKDIKNYERGILFDNGEAVKLLNPGSYKFFNFTGKKRVEVFSTRDPWLVSDNLDVIIKSGIAGDQLTVIDLKDNERALVWVDNRFDQIVSGGVFALWNTMKTIRVEIINVNDPLFTHKEMDAVLRNPGTEQYLNIFDVSEGFTGLYFFNGKLVFELSPGRYVFWKGVGKIKLFNKDLRETLVEINGQDILSNDNVSLRLNAILSYRITDAVKAVLFSDDISQNLYREAQLALRAVIGTKDLDGFLTDKESVNEMLFNEIQKTAGKAGVEVLSFGIRDIILPGEIKELMNKVTEAKKEAEANLVSRREEVAAIRSQVNSAKMLENNPTLMRLRELEVLEKIAANSTLNVILGNEKLTEKVVNLL